MLTQNHRFPMAIAAMCAALVATLFAGFPSTAGAEVMDSRATLALTENPPTIDGEISEGEWARALRTARFLHWKSSEFEARWGYTMAAFTADRLYLAVVSEVPPTGPLATKQFRDARLIMDSGIEVWIDPNRSRRESGEKGDLRFYQNFFNALGTIAD